MLIPHQSSEVTLFRGFVYLFVYYLKCLGCGTHSPVFEFRYKQEIFLFFETSIPALGPSQPPILWVLWSFPGVQRSRTSRWSFNLQSAPRLRMSGDTSPLLLYTLRAGTRKLFSFHLFICSLLTTLFVNEYTASNDNVWESGRGLKFYPDILRAPVQNR